VKLTAQPTCTGVRLELLELNDFARLMLYAPTGMDLSAVVRPAPGGDREEVLIPATMISDLANEHGRDQKWLAQFRQMLDQVAALGWWDASTDYLKVHVERLHTERQ